MQFLQIFLMEHGDMVTDEKKPNAGNGALVPGTVDGV